jgi:RHS repeat-associated protein
LQWSIDAWGNRTNQTATGGTCDAFSQPVGTNNRFSNSSYQYDAAGDMTYDAVHHYSYDAEGRVSAVDSGSTASYTYDAQGRRVAKTAGSALTYYVRDLAGHVMSEYSCQTCWSVGYIDLNGGLAAIYEAATTYFVHGDHLGSTRLMTAYPTPSVAECDDYYPFGELIACGSTGGTTHKFTGKERDTESNLDNFEARYRSVTLGRFMSPDPGNAGADASNPQSWNMYGYVLNNPLAFTDPTGLDPCAAGDEPVCTPGAATEFGGPFYYDGEDSGDPQQQGQNPPVTPAPNPPLPLGTSGTPVIEVVTNLHLGFCQTSDSICARLLKQLINYLDYAKRSPQSITVMGVFPVVRVAGVGGGITVAHIPSSHTWCAGPVLGVATAGKAVNGGPLILGNEANAKAVLSGFSWNAGAQATPLEGVQGVWNKNGSFAGPTGGTQGASVTASYSWCW